MPITINGNAVSTVKRNGTTLAELDYNGSKVWPAAVRVSTFVFNLPASDKSIDLWLTQSAANAVTVTMDDGTVLTSNQLKANFPYTFATSGIHTVTVAVADGESWYPAVASDATISFVGCRFTSGSLSAEDAKLKSVSLGGGINAYLVDFAAMFAFYRCKGLTSVDLSGFDNEAVLGFTDCTALESISFGSNRYNIGAAAFQGCASLTFVSIPSNIDTVVSYAFADSGLLNVDVGAETVQENAFAGCFYLENIWLRSTITTIGYTDKGPWEGCRPGASLYCEPNAQPSGWKRSFDEYDDADDLHYLAQWGQTTAPWDVPEPTIQTALTYALHGDTLLFDEIDDRCPTCGGTGIVEEQETCPVCGGSGHAHSGSYENYLFDYAEGKLEINSDEQGE